MLSSVSGSSRWGSPASFSCSLQLLAREKEHLCGKRRIINLLHSGSFPSDLGWQSEFFPQSHLPTISGFPCSYFCIFDICLCNLVSWLLSSLPKFISSQSQGAVLLGSAPWLSSPFPILKVPADRAIPQLLLSTPWSSFLVESHPFLIGLMGLCEVWGWLLQLLPSFRGPSIRTINQLSFPLQSGGKVFLSLHKCLLYMQKCMSAFCLQ